MNSQRRRANDFTDSLNSFRQVSDEQNNSVFEEISQDSLDTDSIRNRQCGDHNRAKNDASHADSIILAGNFVRPRTSDSFKAIQENYINTYKDKQSISDILSVSDKTSYASIKPDFNKCINLFHNEHLKEYDTSRKLNISSSSELVSSKDIEYHQLNKNKTSMVQLMKDSPRSISLNSLKSTLSNTEIKKIKSCTMLNSDWKKDTDCVCNIKSDKLSLAETATKSNQEKDDTFLSFYDAFSLPKTSVLQNQKESYSTEKCQKIDSSSERSSKEELNPTELRKFLQSLDQKSIREEPVQERLRRMSTNYNDSPKNFTERLLTIIEESFAIDSHANVSLCRLIDEFQKCNVIEDETAPEWIHSSPSMSISIRVRKGSQEFKNDLRKSLGAASNKDVYATPPRFNINSPNKAYRRTPKNILHNIRSPQLDNTSTFESLEAYCERLYPNEFKTLATREKNLCQSPLRNMNRILRACENQMASLENSPNVHEQLKQARSTSDSISQRNTVPDALSRLLSYEQCDKTNSQSVPDMLKQQTELNKRYERIKPDNLRNSLIHEIAKKRQKCIDTVKIMQIEADSESMGAQKICTTNNNESKPIVNDAKFMETLKCVKKYQDYLEQNKPLLSYLQRSESYNSCSPHDKNIPTKKVPNKNFNTDIVAVPPKTTTLKVPKSSTTRKRSTSTSSLKLHVPNKVTSSKPKLFYTPGKTTVQATIKNSRPKRTYFPNQLDATSKQKENHVSPHEKSIYRQIGTYDYIKSPIASYIRGTDPYLVKNLRPKTDENLLTPRRKQANQSSKPNMKFRLSPKEKSTQTSVKENIANNFLHPKVNYKLPSHVHTIKEGEHLKVGNRVNQLLRSTQDKVVIRHEGRSKSVQTDLEQSEICYDSAEDSVHVEQTARKTYFSRVRKNF